VLACKALNVEPEERETVGKEFDADYVRELLAEHADGDRILVVGHNPTFEQVVQDLTGARVDFKKGGVAAVRMTGSARGDLLVLLRPRELESIAVSPLPGE
jgi:phosphohistidine phosphatase